MLGEVPELVDFLFLEDAPDDPDSWQKAIAGDELAPRILADALAAYETCPWDSRLAARGDAGHRGVGRAASSARPRRRSGWPSWAGRGACRSSTRWPCSGRDETRRRLAAALARLDRRCLMLLAPLRWALRIALLVRGGDRPLLRRDPGAGLADLAPVRPAPGGRHPGHGGGPVRLRAVPGPAGAARPGADALPAGLRPPDHGDGQQAAGGQVHRGGVGRDVPREARACRRRRSSRRGATTATRTSPTPLRDARRRTTPRSCWSPPTRSTRTAPWPSRRSSRSSPVAHADPDVAHHGLVDGALLLEGGGRRRARADHRLQPPGVAARRLSGSALRCSARGRGRWSWRGGGAGRGGVLNVMRTTVPRPWAVPTPMTQVAWPGCAAVAVADDPGVDPEVGGERAVAADVGAALASRDVAVGGVGGRVHPPPHGGGALGDEPGPRGPVVRVPQAAARDGDGLAVDEAAARGDPDRRCQAAPAPGGRDARTPEPRDREARPAMTAAADHRCMPRPPNPFAPRGIPGAASFHREGRGFNAPLPGHRAERAPEGARLI